MAAYSRIHVDSSTETSSIQLTPCVHGVLPAESSGHVGIETLSKVVDSSFSPPAFFPYLLLPAFLPNRTQTLLLQHTWGPRFLPPLSAGVGA